MAEDIVLKFTADITELKKRLEDIEKGNKKAGESAKKAGKDTENAFKSAGDSLNNSLNNSIKNIGAGLIAAFSVDAILRFSSASIDAFAKAEEQTNKLRFAVEKVGKQGTAAFGKLVAQAKELSKQTFFDDEDIQQAQSMLSTIGLTTNEIKKLTPLILDLATKQGTDLVAATEKAISAINGQTRSLKDVGANFDSTGTKAGDYNLLIENLTRLQGSAADALNTTSGELKKQEVELENLQESIGQRLAPVLINLKRSALEALNGLLLLFGLGEKNKTQAELLQDAAEATAKAVATNAETFSDEKISRLIKTNTKDIETLKNEYYEFLKLNTDDAQAKNRKQAAFVELEIENELLKDILATRKKQAEFDKQFPASIAGLSVKQMQQQIAELEKVEGISRNIVDDAINVRKKGIEDLLKKQEAANEKALKDKKDALEKESAAFDKFYNDLLSEQERVTNIDFKKFTENLEEKKKEQKKFDTFIEDSLKEIESETNKTYDNLVQGNKNALARTKQLIQDIFSTTAQVTQALFDISSNNRQTRFDELQEQNDLILDKYDEEAAALEEKNQRGALSDKAYEVQRAELLKKRKAQEEDFAKQQRRFAREEAVARKTAAIFSIILNTAQGITAALTSIPPNIPLSILVGITGAAQLAVANSTPVPKLKKGTRFVERNGNPSGVDTIPAMLDEGERVISRMLNKKNWDVYNSIETGNFEEFVQKKYVLPAMMQFKKMSEAHQRAELGHSIGKAIVTSGSGDKEWMRAFSQGMSISNGKQLAKMFARELVDVLPKQTNHW